MQLPCPYCSSKMQYQAEACALVCANCEFEVPIMHRGKSSYYPRTMRKAPLGSFMKQIPTDEGLESRLKRLQDVINAADEWTRFTRHFDVQVDNMRKSVLEDWRINISNKKLSTMEEGKAILNLSERRHVPRAVVCEILSQEGICPNASLNVWCYNRVQKYKPIIEKLLAIKNINLKKDDVWNLCEVAESISENEALKGRITPIEVIQVLWYAQQIKVHPCEYISYAYAKLALKIVAAGEDPKTTRDIAEKLHTTISTASHSLRLLESQGFIKKYKNKCNPHRGSMTFWYTSEQETRLKTFAPDFILEAELARRPYFTFKDLKALSSHAPGGTKHLIHRLKKEGKIFQLYQNIYVPSKSGERWEITAQRALAQRYSDILSEIRNAGEQGILVKDLEQKLTNRTPTQIDYGIGRMIEWDIIDFVEEESKDPAAPELFLRLREAAANVFKI